MPRIVCGEEKKEHQSGIAHTSPGWGTDVGGGVGPRLGSFTAGPFKPYHPTNAIPTWYTTTGGCRKIEQMPSKHPKGSHNTGTKDGGGVVRDKQYSLLKGENIVWARQWKLTVYLGLLGRRANRNQIRDTLKNAKSTPSPQDGAGARGGRDLRSHGGNSPHGGGFWGEWVGGGKLTSL